MEGRTRGSVIILTVSFLLLVLGSPMQSLAQSTTGALHGHVTDPSGADVGGATVQVTGANGKLVTATTAPSGVYDVKNLAPGTYDVQVTAKGFALFESKTVTITAGQTQRLDAALEIEEQQEKVMVQADAPTVDVNPENNVGAIVLKQEDLKALSDDPDELQNDLEALAGPSAGPNGGQIYIDGFTAGQLPPKSAIREIRINQNPFSSEYDKLGYGRIEIFTKPGTDQWHGNIQVQGNDSEFNTPNPFAHGTEPDYYSTLYNGSIGGPLGKKASIFFSGQYRDINDVSVIDAEILDPTTLEPTTFQGSVPEPRTRINVGPRFDYQLSKTNTLSVRYQYYRDSEGGQGLAGFALPEQAYSTISTEHTLQVTDSQVIGSNLVNEIHFQYLRDIESQNALSSLPTITVLGSFTNGGNNQQNIADTSNHYEFQNYTQWQHGNQTIKFGVRLRETTDHDYSNAGFNGNYTFTSLAAYQAFEQSNGVSGFPSQINVVTGPNQSTLSPQVYVSEFDSGWYVQDDWRVRSNITLSGGVRAEQQTHISDHLDWEPRVALAWGIGKGKATPKTVLRVGSGLFYDRFTENLVLQAALLNGLNQTKYVATLSGPCPLLNVNTVPTIASLSANCGASASTLPTTYSIAPHLHAPGTLQTAVTLERQVNKTTTASVSYLNSHGFDQLLTNNINTPLPGTFIVGSPVYPLGYPGNVYQFESAANFRQNQMIAQINYRAGSRVSLHGYYTLGYADSDTAGPTSFPSNPFDIREDWGRASFDVRQRVFLAGSISLPHNIALYPFLLAASGTPYSLTISRDLIGSSQFNQRPAFASSISYPADVVVTRFGTFDAIPQPGETIVPINSLTGPPKFSMNLRVSKTWGFGVETSRPGAGSQQGGGPGGGPGGGRGPGGGGGGGRGGGFGGGPGGFGGGATTNRRYSLTLSVQARNLFNFENLDQPSGVLTAPDSPGETASVPYFFGKSNGLAGGAFSSASASRLIYLQLGFTF
ncbi:MAG: carboxypeptidase regulatory-like domain-containing protein [Candidatus Acidiferrales bacterium]